MVDEVDDDENDDDWELEEEAPSAGNSATTTPSAARTPPPLPPRDIPTTTAQPAELGVAAILGLTGNGEKLYNEIISSEKSYLGFISKFDKELTDKMLAKFDTLSTKDRAGCDRAKLKEMFDTLQALTAISKEMIVAMEKPDLKTVNDLLKLATPYLSKFATIKQDIPPKIATNTFSKVFDPLDANALTIMAVQRGPRYALLFRELVKLSAEGSSIHQMAQTLLNTSMSTASKINEDKRAGENQDLHQKNQQRLQPLVDLVQKRLESNDYSIKTQILLELIKQFALQDKANQPLNLKQAVINTYTSISSGITKKQIDDTLAKTTIPGFTTRERRSSLEDARKTDSASPALAAAQSAVAADPTSITASATSSSTSTTSAAETTSEAETTIKPNIDTAGLSDIQQQKLKDFQARLQTNLDKQNKALNKAEAANPSSYLELYKEDMKGMLAQTRQTFENAKVPKDENEAFAQLMEYFFQLLALLTSPATQLVNAGFQKAWNEMKQIYHERQADLQGDKYKDVKHQEERLAKLDGMIEKSNNALAELNNELAKNPDNPKFARKIAFEEAKRDLLTEARDKTLANLQTLKQEQSVALATAPKVAQEEEESILATSAPTTPVKTPPPLPSRDTKPKAPVPSIPAKSFDANGNVANQDIADQLDELFDSRPKALTPQAQSHTQERAMIATSLQITVEDLNTILSEKSKEALNDLAIKQFTKVAPTQPGAGPHIKLDMYCTSDRTENAKTTEVRAEQKPGTEGVTYTMKKDLPPEDKLQTIEQICRLAVETAKPGTEFKIPSNDPTRKAATEAALDKALQAKYPEQYVKGQFKVPDKQPTLSVKAR